MTAPVCSTALPPAQLAHLLQGNQIGEGVQPVPSQPEGLGAGVELRDIRRQAGDSPALEAGPQQLKFIVPPSVADRALPVDLPVRRAQWGYRLEFEGRVRARHDPLVIELVALRGQIPLDERADETVVALQLERNAH